VTSAAEATARALATIPSISSLTGQYVSTNADGTVLVDFSEGPVQVYSAGFYTPLPGESVRVLKVDGFTMMLGPVTPKSVYGRVTATGLPKLTVALPDGSSVQLGYVSSSYPSPAVNDPVLINWGNGGIVVGKVTSIPGSDYLPPAVVGAATRSGSADFRATGSGSYDHNYNSWFQDDVWASVHANGVWFYGSTIADTIPDNATITAVHLTMNEFYSVGGQTAIGTHALTSKSGAPTVSNAAGQRDATGWVLPTSFGDALKTGAAWGVGTVTGNYFHKYQGRASDAQSGMLHIEWSI